jgi:hypothetical protein
MAQRPLAFVRDGDVPYQTLPIILGAGETREIPGTLRYLLLQNPTDSTKILVSFNGSSFYNLPAGEQLKDFEADGFWIQNTDVVPNAVTIVTGMASLNAQHVVIDSTTPIPVAISGTPSVNVASANIQGKAADGQPAGPINPVLVAGATPGGTMLRLCVDDNLGRLRVAAEQPTHKAGMLNVYLSDATGTPIANAIAAPGAGLAIAIHSMTLTVIGGAANRWAMSDTTGSVAQLAAQDMTSVHCAYPHPLVLHTNEPLNVSPQVANQAYLSVVYSIVTV